MTKTKKIKELEDAIEAAQEHFNAVLDHFHRQGVQYRLAVNAVSHALRRLSELRSAFAKAIRKNR